MVFNVNNAEALRIVSTGYVGIGTTAPTAKLQVVSSSTGSAPLVAVNNATSGSNQTALLTVNSDVAGGYLFTTSSNYSDSATFDANPVANAFYLRSSANATGGLQLLTANSSAPIVFKPNQTEAMRIVSTGYVGIGTSTPSYTLDVNGIARAKTGFQAYSGSGNNITLASTGLYSTGWGWPMTLKTVNVSGSSNNYQLQLSSNGSVGINNGSPSATLHVGGTGRFDSDTEIRGTISATILKLSDNPPDPCTDANLGAIKLINGRPYICRSQ